MFKSKDPVAPADASGEAASVQLARLRARRRLIGAALLVGLGIAGFPVLFETQPRPIAVDIPIEIPQREQVAPLKLPADKPSAPTAAVDAEPAAASASAAQSPPPATGTAAAAPPAAPLAAASAASAVPAASRSERVAAEPQRAPAVADPQREAQRAQAILDGKPAAAAAAAAAPAPASAPGKAGRFVVQAGAYTDSAALREARQKVEKLGLKTYTQVIESDAGRRTRVRVGPFDSREDAEKAAARIKSAGLAASILSI